MRWFDLKAWATCALLVSACSDDGVPAASGTDGATSGASSATAGESDPTAASAVTTADTADSDSDDTSPSTTDDPTETGSSDTDGTTSDTGSSGTGPGTDDGSTGSTSTGGGDEPECMVDEDCMLVDDCCTCDAIPLGDEPPKCDISECLVPTCQSFGLGVPAVQCNFGTCEVEEVSCDPFLVSCDEKEFPMPDCPDGQAPRVVDECWGECIPVEYCDVVPSCDDCGEDEACVEGVFILGPRLTCEPIPPACEGVPSCDCLGEVCEAPFDLCADDVEPKTGSEISCSCPTC